MREIAEFNSWFLMNQSRRYYHRVITATKNEGDAFQKWYKGYDFTT